MKSWRWRKSSWLTQSGFLSSGEWHFFLPRKNSCSYLERLQTPQKELFHSDVLLFVCLFVIVMSWHWKASNNSLWLWNVKNGSLTPSVICMTPLPSHKLSFSATQKERLVHSCIPKDLYAIFLLVCKPSYIYLSGGLACGENARGKLHCFSYAWWYATKRKRCHHERI